MQSRTCVFASFIIAALLCAADAQAQPEGRTCAAEPTNEQIAPGDAVNCTIGIVGDSDLFRFRGFASDVVSIRVIDQAGGSNAPSCFLEVFRPNEATPLASTAGNTGCEIRTTLDRTGMFTVRVSEVNNDALMNYFLEFDRMLPNSSTATVMNPGNVFSNQTINPHGDADLYVFDGAAGDVISLRVTDPTGGSNLPSPALELFRPNGSLAASSAGNTTALLDVTLDATGIFTARVTEVANDATMTYHVEYQCLQGKCPAFRRITSSFGLGPVAGQGGWLPTNYNMAGNQAVAIWSRLPWPAYNAAGGDTRVAAGDVDGDGLDEIVVGLGRGGGGWMAVLDDAAHGHALLRWIQVQWTAYNLANGEVWPAVGDIDGDGLDEIVAGLGPGGSGWFEVFDDGAASFAHLAFRRIAWPAYAGLANSVIHPAIGNIDGVGASEIIIGLGAGSNGWMEVVNGASGGYSHRSWFQLHWNAYSGANGTTFPASGDLDGDGRSEIVAGLGSGGGGWLEVFKDTAGSVGHSTWLRIPWAAYNSAVGETHPAIGNVDADADLEIVVGQGAFATQGGWFFTFDHQAAGFANLGWRNLGWPAFTALGGATYPAIGLFR